MAVPKDDYYFDLSNTANNNLTDKDLGLGQTYPIPAVWGQVSVLRHRSLRLTQSNNTLDDKRAKRNWLASFTLRPLSSPS